MKIEKGMYVRTNKGEILDVFCKTKNYIIAYFKENPYKVEDIKKASYNIIDLIEEGDYVNGNKVIYVEDLDALEYLFIDVDGNSYYSAIDKECNNPKTIVTKEQFNNIKYEVK